MPADKIISERTWNFPPSTVSLKAKCLGALPVPAQGNPAESEPHPAGQLLAPRREPISYPFGYFYWLVALALFIYAYYPSHTIKLLVEHWEFNDSLNQLHFHPGRLKDWLTVCFDTPFKDFRFIPGAYLCQFISFSLFKNHFGWYWFTNIVLHVTNSLLISLLANAWCGKRLKDNAGFLTGALFLVVPGCYETIIWTFFSYKILTVTLLLLCLLAYERFLRDGNIRNAAACCAVLFIMYLCYEASLLIGCALIAGLFFLDKTFSRRKVLVLASAVAVTWMIYAGGYLCARGYVKESLQMSHQMVKTSALDALLPVHLRDYALSGLRWLWQGTALENSGIPLALSDRARTFAAMLPGSQGQLEGPPLQFYTALRNDLNEPYLLYILLIAAVWFVLLFNIVRKTIPARRIALALLILFFGSALVVVGRTLSNGTNYLAGLSIYHYLPASVFALVLGLMLVNATVKYDLRAKVALSSFVLLIIFLAASTRQIVSAYMKVEGRTLALFQRVEETLARTPSSRIYIDYKMLRAPTWSSFVTDESHTFHAFHLVFGDAIVERRNLADVVMDGAGIVRTNSERISDK